MHDTESLQRACQRDPITPQYFLGMYSWDKGPCHSEYQSHWFNNNNNNNNNNNMTHRHIFEVKMVAHVTSEKSCTVTARPGNPSSTTSEPWECSITQVCLKMWWTSILTPATGDVDPRWSDARNHQITPNCSKIIVHTQHTPSWLVHHQAVAKPYPREREQAIQKHNYHYMVLLRNHVNTRYAKALGNRWLGDSLAFWQMYQKATQQPFGYLVIDHHPVYIRTHFLWEELKPVTVLQPNSVRKR